MSIPLLACMASVAAFYHLPPRVLPSIQAVERGAVGVIHLNSDGSQDLGIMQVNASWVAKLAAVARITPESVRVRLVYDGCFNIAASSCVGFTLTMPPILRSWEMSVVGCRSHSPAGALGVIVPDCDGAVGALERGAREAAQGGDRLGKTGRSCKPNGCRIAVWRSSPTAVSRHWNSSPLCVSTSASSLGCALTPVCSSQHRNAGKAKTGGLH